MAETTVPIRTQSAGGAAEAKPPATREETRYLIPPVDIHESAEGLTVIADLPGVDKDGVDVHVENGVLTIRGRVRRTALGEGLYSEYTLMDYFRQFELGNAVDQAKISAQLKNGVLTVLLPRQEALKPRQVTVEVA
jgi:HSP20 family molecular chaperone IbpA